MIRRKRSILVHARPKVGDVLLATPLIRSLRLAFPEATIDALVDSDQQPILRGNPDLDHVWTIGEGRSARYLYRAIVANRGRYDIGVSPSGADRAHFYLLVCARRRYAWSQNLEFHQLWKRWLAAATVETNPRNHVLIDVLRLADALGIERDYTITPPTPRYDPGERIAELGEKPYAVLHLASPGKQKHWSLEGWGRVAVGLRERGLRAVLTGGDDASEHAYLEDARSLMPDDTLNLAGRLGISELPALLRSASLYVGIDTLTSHVAAAVGAHSVVLFGPSDPIRWSPWPLGYAGENPLDAEPSRGRIEIVRGDSCPECIDAPCRRKRTHSPGCPRMLSISPEDVLRAVDDCLASSQPVAAQGP